MSGKSEEKYESFRFKFARLTDFIPNNDAHSRKTVKHKVDPCERRLSFFDVYCPWCGASGTDGIIKREVRLNKRKGAVQRYHCKKCGRSFSLEGWGHFPLWVVEAILSFAVEGFGLSATVKELKREALRHDLKVKISRQSVSNIIKRCVEAFLKFEEAAGHECPSLEWQIDDTPQPSTRGFKYPLKQHPNGNRDFWWITNVFDVCNRYWLVAYVSKERDAQVSEKAIRMALKRAHDAPHSFKCDGSRAHIRGIKNCLPLATVFSKKKSEDFGHINLIESLHSLMRRKGIKKRKKFRCLMTLQYLVDLVRIYHNFLHRHDALDGITPAAKVGMAPIFRGWGEFIRYVYSHPK